MGKPGKVLMRALIVWGAMIVEIEVWRWRWRWVEVNGGGEEVVDEKWRCLFAKLQKER